MLLSLGLCLEEKEYLNSFSEKHVLEGEGEQFGAGHGVDRSDCEAVCLFLDDEILLLQSWRPTFCCCCCKFAFVG